MPTCSTCIWYSTGLGDDVRGSGWCYSEECYKDEDDSCPFWDQSLRKESVDSAPLTPDAHLAANCAKMDKDCDD
jgi:hypothetical protein